MQKTKIEWVKNPDGTQGYSWNPIKGPCPKNCWYCYGHSLNKRFWKYDKPFFKEEEWQMAFDPKHLEVGIFVCSIFDLFHPITETHIFGSKKITWRSLILGAIEDLPQHRFYILTKFPQNIDRPMPDNVWLGVTFDGRENTEEFLKKESALYSAKAKLKFASYEPLLGSPWLVSIDWVIAGRLTRYGNKDDPPRGWIEVIVDTYSKKPTVPIFLKDNLKEIWGEPLIQEMPE